MFDFAFPHHGMIVHNGVAFDRSGIGGASARSGSGAAAWVKMRPDTFLALATRLNEPRPSLQWIRGQILNGEPISPPELTFRIPDGFIPAVSSHEGRHRMTAIHELKGSQEVPVRIVLAGVDYDDLSVAQINRIRPRARAQRSSRVVEGPLFGEAVIDLGGIRASGVPPPAYISLSGAILMVSSPSLFRNGYSAPARNSSDRPRFSANS